MREFQRAHESLPDTTKRLGKKYGHDELLATVIDEYEEAKGINYAAMNKELPVKPVKFISIAQAAEILGIPTSTIVRWAGGGYLNNVGKWERPEQPGTGVIFVDPLEVEKLINKAGAEEEVTQPKLLTLKAAEAVYGIPFRTLHGWHQRGQLPEKGREIFYTKGGGKAKILVDEEDVLRLKTRWTPKNKTTD